MIVYKPEFFDMEQIRVKHKTSTVPIVDRKSAKTLEQLYALFEKGKFQQAYELMTSENTARVKGEGHPGFYALENFVNYEVKTFLTSNRHYLNSLLLVSVQQKSTDSMEMKV